MDRKRLIWHMLILATILIVLLAEFAYMSSAPEIVDEGANWKQIKIFLNRETSLKLGLNVIPGYHALIAALMILFQKSGLISARFLTTWISFASIIVFYLLTWKVCAQPSLEKTLQYSFFSLFFPFFPLVYTNILAMLLLLLAFYLVLWKRYTLSGIVAFLNILARTNNIAWFAFLFAFILIENYGLNWREYTKSIRFTWFYLLGFGAIAAFLEKASQSGLKILTWNGLWFDFDVLAEESGLLAENKALGLDHIDMMFHFFCLTGFGLGLERAAKGMGLPGKLAGMSGEMAPKLWKAGRRQEVLAYVAQDARTTLNLATRVDQQGSLRWMSKSGRL